MSDAPLILARELHDLEHLGGVVTYETTEIRVHLTFTEVETMRQVTELLLVSPSLTAEERVFVAVPASWSLYVHPAVLALLEGHLDYRVEGR